MVVAPRSLRMSWIISMNRVWCHDRDQFSQHAAAKPFPFGCQPSTLIVIEMEPLSPLQLLKDPNLLLQELNLLPLLFVQLPSDAEEQHSYTNPK